MNKRLEDIINNLKQFKGFSIEDVSFVRAPGRVNLVGGHTDYNLGYVLPCSVNKDIIIGGFNYNGNKATFNSLNFNKSYTFDIEDSSMINEQWINYIKGIITEFKNKGHKVNGLKAVIHGTIPMESGMGSSGAYEIALALLFKTLNNVEISDIDLVKLCYKAEKEFLGIETGVMDQYASLFGKKNSAIFIDCKTLDYKIINIKQKDIELLVINSNVKRSAKKALNQRKSECAEAVNILNENGLEINSLRDLSADNFEKYKHFLPKIIAKRVKHIVYENERVLIAKESLEKGDLETVGNCMKESHVSLKEDYQVSCKELDALFDILINHKGVYGSRMTGAGFGGCVIALIDKKEEKNIIERVENRYPKMTGISPSIYPCEISDGASSLDVVIN